MNKWLPAIIVFSVMLLIPSGYQTVFAGLEPGQCAPTENLDPPPSASPGTPTSTPQCIPTTDSWVVGNPDPVTISFDPGAGPWIKHLPYPNLPVHAQTGIVEDLIVGPDVAWDDWHEEIQPGSNWEFISATITTSAGHNIVVPGLGIFSGSDKIWVDFVPPLQPGTTVHIEKFVQYIGPPQVPGVMVMWEYPTVKQIGGEIIPIEQTSLLLANAQTFSWMIPVLLSGIGIGLFVFSKKS